MRACKSGKSGRLPQEEDRRPSPTANIAMLRRAKRALKRSFLLALLVGTPSFGQPVADNATPDPANPLNEARTIIAAMRPVAGQNGVADLLPIRIGQIEQWISVRGRDRDNPILLFIHGGPGYSEMPASWAYQSPWEDFFTVVQWDQRGTGKTGAANDMDAVAPTISKARMIKDVEELIPYLLKKYNKKKIFLLGHSYGSEIGLQIAHDHPEWLHAYIGMGQSIHSQAAEEASYRWVLSRARDLHDAEGIEELKSIAPYPERDGSIPLSKISTQRKFVIKYGGLGWGRSGYQFYDDLAKLSPDYDLKDLALRESEVVIDRLSKDFGETDFRNITRIDCPVFILAGRYDYQTPSDVALQWFSKLRAPKKDFHWFEKSAHVMHLEEPGRFLQYIVHHVLPQARQ